MIFKNLTLKKNLLILQTLALIPWFLGLSIVIWQIYPHIREFNIQLKARERLPMVLELLWELQRHRGLSGIYLLSSDSKERKRILETIKEVEEKTEEKFKNLDQISWDHKEKEIFAEIKETYQSLKINHFVREYEENYIKHTQLTTKVLEFLRQEGEAHRLFGDPDLYLRTLAQVALMELPNFIETLGKTRALGSRILARGRILPYEKNLLLKYTQTIPIYENAINWTLINIKYPEDIIYDLNIAQKALYEYKELLNHYVILNFKKDKERTPIEFFLTATHVIDSLIKVNKSILNNYLSILAERKKAYIKNLVLLILLISIIFGVISSFFYLSYRALVKKLSSISREVKKIGQGDLSVRIPTFSKDEIGELIEVLNRSLDTMEHQYKEIYFLHYFDELTSAPKKEKLLLDLKNIKNPAFLLVDINRFKEINFIYGDKCGDEILKELYQRLKKAFQSEVYRVGADAFIVLFDLSTNHKSKENLSCEALTTLEKLQEMPFTYEDNEIYINLTSVFIYECSYTEKILTYAYSSLAEAKTSHKPYLEIKQPDTYFSKIYEENNYWFNKFKKAYHEDRLIPYYQPVIDTETGKVVKFEALLRLMDENGEVYGPFKFLNLAKRAGFGPKITLRMLNKVVRDFLFLPYEVAINLSYEDFYDKELLTLINKTIEEKPTIKLCFEFLEIEEIKDSEYIISKILEFKKKGIKIAIDDFGTGYSNLERLIILGVDYLKIDGSIIKRLPYDEAAKAIIKALSSFAKVSGISLIAEFVENEDILKEVRALGIRYAQGYFFSPPISIEKVKDYLENTSLSS